MCNLAFICKEILLKLQLFGTGADTYSSDVPDVRPVTEPPGCRRAAGAPNFYNGYDSPDVEYTDNAGSLVAE